MENMDNIFLSVHQSTECHSCVAVTFISVDNIKSCGCKINDIPRVEANFFMSVKAGRSWLCFLSFL